MSNLIPVKMSAAELVAVLLDIASRVVQGDSFEGNIEYTIPEEFDAAHPDQVEVRGTYRFGNLEGQGGVRMIGTVPQ